MTTFFLVRHALHVLGPGILAGRIPGTRLTDEGHGQAVRVARWFERERVTAVHSSPQERTLETARPIAEQAHITVEIVPALDEVDFGEWAGNSFEMLERDPRWVLWNAKRDSASTPAGETMRDVAKRVVGHIEQVRAGDPAGRIVIVSHAEVIRTAVLHYLGLPFSAFTRIQIDAASISKLVFTDGGAAIASLNERAAA